MNNSNNSNFVESFSFFIRRANIDLMPLYWYVPPRNIFDHEIMFIEEGEVHFSIDDKTYIAKKNDIILIPPRKIHSLKTVGPSRLLQPHIHFDFYCDKDSPNLFIPFVIMTEENTPEYGKIRDNIYEKLGLPILIDSLPEIVSEKIKNLIYEIAELNSISNYRAIIKKKICMNNLLLLLLEKSVSIDGIKTNSVNLVCETIDMYIDKQLNDSFDINTISKHLNYSKNYLSSIYKGQKGITPKKQYIKKKCEKAKDYLRLKDITISEISYILGFNSPSEFTRFFIRETGMSPSKYKKTHSQKI